MRVYVGEGGKAEERDVRGGEERAPVDSPLLVQIHLRQSDNSQGNVHITCYFMSTKATKIVKIISTVPLYFSKIH